MQAPSSNTVGLFEAKTHFSAIVERVRETGVPVRVTRRGEPVVEITPVKPAGPPKLTREEMFERVAARRKTLPPITQEEIREAIEWGRR